MNGNSGPGQKHNGKMGKTRLFLGLACLALAGWISLPVFVGDINAGILLFTPCLLILALALYFDRLNVLVFHRSRKVARIMITLMSVALVLVTGSLAVLAYGGFRQTRESSVLIVLGCQVRGSEPSLMLAKRIRVAADYAKEHPDVRIIATGGKGAREDISEAQCIRDELIRQGIDPARIYLEDRSVNTLQNMQYSAEIMKSENLGTDAIIVTSRYHQYRAALHARKVGLATSPLSSSTALYLAPSYWLREVLALWRAWLLGY